MDSLRNYKEAGYYRLTKEGTCAMKPLSKVQRTHPKLNQIGSQLDYFSLEYVVTMVSPRCFK